MNNTSLIRRFAVAAAALPLLATLGGCSIEKDTPPSLTGPSEFGLSLTLAATPDVVSRDGSSMATVTVTARDAQGRPVSGQRILLGLTPANGGTMSASDVVTGPDGRATFGFIAPPSSSSVDTVSIIATPVGQNFDNSVSRSMSIRLIGPAAPAAAFSLSPSTPERMQVVTFDASATTINGVACGDDCTYIWRFGSEQNATGRVVTYRFQSAATYAVQLTVTSPTGTVGTTTQNVVVSAGTLTPVITLSPTNPQRNTNVIFDGRSSTATGGATIEDYQWDFGDGDTGSGPTASNSFSEARTYTVRLMVRDSFGRTATTTSALTVAP